MSIPIQRTSEKGCVPVPPARSLHTGPKAVVLMASRRLVHLSDLHIGRDAITTQNATALCETLLASHVDHVVVTGDITHRGRREELALFHAIFRTLLDQDRLTVIPGNHDRLGHQVACDIMNDRRVMVRRAPGLYLVCVDSTGPHNRSWLASHGQLTPADLDEVVRALAVAPSGVLVAVLLHHHPLPLPFDDPIERVCAWFGWRWARELELGKHMLAAIRGRCDLVLHGHRHSPREMWAFSGDTRPLGVFNAGSSTEMTRARVFVHQNGRLLGAPLWLLSRAPTPTPVWVGHRGALLGKAG